ncbi:uncharacterized protein [Medicago truncatula]|uniref:uncharacterized protein n=1 Tax=Medicago truncatula TaxID=3880 RepID=UPI000D2F1F6F|nr:uncharacterized protein LOC25501325 [Medicago truncatula]
MTSGQEPAPFVDGLDRLKDYELVDHILRKKNLLEKCGEKNLPDRGAKLRSIIKCYEDEVRRWNVNRPPQFSFEDQKKKPAHTTTSSDVGTPSSTTAMTSDQESHLLIDGLDLLDDYELEEHIKRKKMLLEKVAEKLPDKGAKLRATIKCYEDEVYHREVNLRPLVQESPLFIDGLDRLNDYELEEHIKRKKMLLEKVAKKLPDKGAKLCATIKCYEDEVYHREINLRPRVQESPLFIDGLDRLKDYELEEHIQRKKTLLEKSGKYLPDRGAKLRSMIKCYEQEFNKRKINPRPQKKKKFAQTTTSSAVGDACDDAESNNNRVVFETKEDPATNPVHKASSSNPMQSIPAQIADLRTHIDAQFLNLRKHISMVSSTTVQSIPAQIADLRTHIDDQFLSLRQHVGKASSSNTMQSIPAQIIDLRTHIDDQFLNVRQHISMVSSNTVQSIPAQIADLRIPIDEQFLNLRQHIGTYF